MRVAQGIRSASRGDLSSGVCDRPHIGIILTQMTQHRCTHGTRRGLVGEAAERCDDGSDTIRAVVASEILSGIVGGLLTVVCATRFRSQVDLSKNVIADAWLLNYQKVCEQVERMIRAGQVLLLVSFK